MGFDEFCNLCRCSIFKEGSIQSDTEGSGQTIAAFKLLTNYNCKHQKTTFLSIEGL